MTRWLEQIHERLFAPAPAARLGTVRLLVGAFSVVYLMVRAPVLIDFGNLGPGRFDPVGPCVLLRAPLAPPVVLAIYAVALLAGIAFTLGLRYRVAGPLFGISFLWVTSYRNSWGMVFHNENLVALHALYLGLVPAAGEAVRLTRDRYAGTTAFTSAGRFGFPLRVLSAITVATYVLAGIAKLKISGGTWMEGDILRNYIAYDAVRKMQVGSVYSPLGAWLVQFAWPFSVIGWATMAIELGALLALLSARAARIWTYAVLGFHWGVLAVMAIAFPYPLSGVAFASLLPAEGLWRLPSLSGIRLRLGLGPLRQGGVMQDTVQLQCPYCSEVVEVYLEPDMAGTMVQDCEVCCRPWQLLVAHDEEGDLTVDVTRAQ